MSPQSIRLTVLRVLDTNRPYAVPQEQLLAEVNRLVRPALSLGDLVKHLSWLKASEHIAFQSDPMDPKNADARRWSIREAGIAALNA